MKSSKKYYFYVPYLVSDSSALTNGVALVWSKEKNITPSAFLEELQADISKHTFSKIEMRKISVLSISSISKKEYDRLTLLFDQESKNDKK